MSVIVRKIAEPQHNPRLLLLSLSDDLAASSRSTNYNFLTLTLALPVALTPTLTSIARFKEDRLSAHVMTDHFQEICAMRLGSESGGSFLTSHLCNEARVRVRGVVPDFTLFFL